MPRARKLIPSYLPHKQSGRGRAVWTDAAGRPQQRLLPGPFEFEVSRTTFAQLQLELAAAPAAPRAGELITVSQVRPRLPSAWG